MNIRKGTPNDIPNICKLLINTWQNCYTDFMPSSFLSNLNLEKQIQRHSKYMSSSANYFVVENDAHKLLGFASYGKSRMENFSFKNELYTIYVCKKTQGKGIGKLLLNTILDDIKNDETSLVVSVFEQNPFISFYLKNGFKKIGEEVIDLGQFELIGGIYAKTLTKTLST